MAKKSENTGIKARTIFEHLSGIKEKKHSWESLSEMDKKSFSPFIINRLIINGENDFLSISDRDSQECFFSFIPLRCSNMVLALIPVFSDFLAIKVIILLVKISQIHYHNQHISLPELVT
jgi:hypothetical protein